LLYTVYRLLLFFFLQPFSLTSWSLEPAPLLSSCLYHFHILFLFILFIITTLLPLPPLLVHDSLTHSHNAYNYWSNHVTVSVLSFLIVV
jgi:hypothetical protein